MIHNLYSIRNNSKSKIRIQNKTRKKSNSSFHNFNNFNIFNDLIRIRKYFTVKGFSLVNSLLLFIFMFFCFPFLANSATVQKSSIEPLNRLIVEFDKIPQFFESSISADKKTITINLGNTNFPTEQEILTGEGIIQKVEFSKKAEQTILTITLIAQRGYITATLPFTQGLLVEVFDWNKLNQAEEEYRTALLGLTDDCDLAKPHFVAAINGNIGDAATFLGFCQLSEGKINSALKSFKFAEIKKSTLIDNLAALAQIYSIKKDNVNSEKYVKLFKEKTGRNSCPTIVIPSISEENDVCLETNKYIDSIIKSFEEVTVPDTTNNAAIGNNDTVNSADTNALNNKFKNILDTAKKEQSIWEIENGSLLQYMIGIGLAFILGIVYLYLKWRNKQILEMQKKVARKEASKTTQNIKNETKSNSKANFGNIVNEKMKETSNKVNESSPKEKPINQNKPEASTVKQKPEIPNKSNIDIKKNADNILNYINNLKNEDVIKSDSILKAELANKASLEASKSKQPVASQSPVADLNLTNKIQQKKSATIQLAEHLASEQKKIKTENISKLPNTLDMAPEKLAEISKKLGIEKSSLETKQNLENLEKNEEQLLKLSEKFGIKNK